MTSFTSLKVLFVEHDQNLKVYVFKKKKDTLTKITHKAAKENKTPTDGNTLHWSELLDLWKRAASPPTSLKYEVGPTHLLRSTWEDRVQSRGGEKTQKGGARNMEFVWHVFHHELMRHLSPSQRHLNSEYGCVFLFSNFLTFCEFVLFISYFACFTYLKAETTGAVSPSLLLV